MQSCCIRVFLNGPGEYRGRLKVIVVGAAEGLEDEIMPFGDSGGAGGGVGEEVLTSTNTACATVGGGASTAQALRLIVAHALQ